MTLIITMKNECTFKSDVVNWVWFHCMMYSHQVFMTTFREPL